MIYGPWKVDGTDQDNIIFYKSISIQVTLSLSKMWKGKEDYRDMTRQIQREGPSKTTTKKNLPLE